jgi:putative DNA primase/helicase
MRLVVSRPYPRTRCAIAKSAGKYPSGQGNVGNNGAKRFRVGANGVEAIFSSGKESEWLLICGPLRITAELRNFHGESWSLELTFCDKEGKTKTYVMPARLLAGSSDVWCGELLDRGLEVHTDQASRQALAQYIATAKPGYLARCVDRIGWHGAAFVLPDESFGTADEKVILQFGSSASDHAFAVSGTLEDWRREVAEPCSGNSRLVFSLSAGFAGPLLALVEAENGGFHLRGSSSIGKNTAMLVAASVWGGGGLKGFVRQWRATANALEGVAAAHCDTLLCLDELNQVDGKEAGAVAYMLANGAGKSRARRDGSTRRPAEWRILFLSNGEISLAEKVSEDFRRNATAGQKVRLVDIQADAGAGLGLFEDIHGCVDGHVFAVQLKDASERYYGIAARAFLGRLVESPDAAREILGHARSEFIKTNVSEASDGQVRRVAERFALVAAAGELAIAWKILPWKRGEAAAAAATCYRSWLAERGSIGPAEIADGIAQIRRFIEADGESRFTEWNIQKNENGQEIVNLSERPTMHRLGFRKRTDAREIDYYVLPEAWRNELCIGYNAQALARELAQLGFLIRGNDGKLASAHKPPGQAQTMRLYHLSAAILGDVLNADTANAAQGPKHPAPRPKRRRKP